MVVGVIFGGKSCEHDISIITGFEVISACRHKTVAVYIDRDGVWYASKKPVTLKDIRNKRGFKRVHLRTGESGLYYNNRLFADIDVAVLALHGMFGEDGTVQGMLELSNIPYTCSGVCASAIGIDKSVMKSAFKGVGLNVLDYITLSRDEYNRDVYTSVKAVKTKLGFPAIVKPARLGSSIGISVAKSWSEFFAALRVAFQWDNTVVIERALTDFTELNCAVLSDGQDEIVSEIEQPIGWETFLKFDDKYSTGVKNKGRILPAELPPEIEKQVKESAVKAFNAIGAVGVARVDFILSESGTLYVNEINTIPGSLSAPLFAPKGIGRSELIDRLINIAITQAKNRSRIKTYFRSDVLSIDK